LVELKNQEHQVADAVDSFLTFALFIENSIKALT